MRDYGKMAPQFWTGETGKKIRAAGPQVQVIACYLITCPSSTMLGLYYLPLPTLCHEVGCSLQGASKALLNLSQIGFAYYDEHTEYVWIPNMARFQIGENMKPGDKRIPYLIKALEGLKNIPFFNSFLERYHHVFHLDGISPINAPSMPLDSPSEARSMSILTGAVEQEQESPLPPQDELGGIVDRWNAIPGVIPMQSVSGPIRTRLLARLREHPSLPWWEEIFARVSASDFLTGRKTDFAASLDWVLGPKNLAKLLAGNYDSRTNHVIPKSLVELL